MTDLGISDLLTLVQTLAIIVAIIIAVYFSRRQIQALSADLEARVLNDLDEKLHRMGEIFIEKPEFVGILSKPAAGNGTDDEFQPEGAFAYYVMFFCAHCFHMRERGILGDNEWQGWLQWIQNAFRTGKLGDYWKEGYMKVWVDPAFRDFIDREVMGPLSTPQKN